MSRCRLDPTREQELVLRQHCKHARNIWNLALEQNKYYRTGGRTSYPPNHNERCRQLTEIRGEYEWVGEGSQTVQQQALRDFDRTLWNGIKGICGLPTWRKAGKNEGFRIVHFKASHVNKLNKNWSGLFVPKIGWVRFRSSKEIDFTKIKSYRVTLNPAGQWHVAFAIIPVPVAGPGINTTIGIDMGVVHAVALSNGEFHDFKTDPRLNKRIKGLQRALARAKRGSNRRKIIKQKLAKNQLKKANRRKDFAEKKSTDIARRFDYIGREDLRIKNMVRSAKGTIENPGRNVKAKSGLNREISDRGWGLIFTRLEQKAPGRVTTVDPRNSSTECSECHNIDKKNRESQAIFRCQQCGFTINADTNGARIVYYRAFAAGHAGKGQSVKTRLDARRGTSVPLKREPQLLLTV